MDNAINAVKKKKKRKRKFSRDELEVLVSGYEKYSQLLSPKIGPTITKAKKDDCWLKITNQVNAVGTGVVRSVAEVKMKWKDFKKAAKKQVVYFHNNISQTGSGTRLKKLDPLIERVAAIMKDASLLGIPEGMEVGGENDDLSTDEVFTQETTVSTVPQISGECQTTYHVTIPDEDIDIIIREGDVCAMRDSHTQTVITGDDKMSVLLEQGERQIQALTRQATAYENVARVLIGIELQLARIADNMANVADSHQSPMINLFVIFLLH